MPRNRTDFETKQQFSRHVLLQNDNDMQNCIQFLSFLQFMCP